jgi:hypothetical protein
LHCVTMMYCPLASLALHHFLETPSLDFRIRRVVVKTLVDATRNSHLTGILEGLSTSIYIYMASDVAMLCHAAKFVGNMRCLGRELRQRCSKTTLD